MRIGARLLTFGYQTRPDLPLRAGRPRRQGLVRDRRGTARKRFPYRVGAPGEHFVRNSLAVLAALRALGADIDARPAGAGVALSRADGPRRAHAARMRRTADILLIDESYNANPASVRAALAAMATTPREEFPRRIAVLGDMLELGDAARGAAPRPKEAVDAAGVDLVFACGPMMKLLMTTLRPRSAAPGPHPRPSWRTLCWTRCGPATW